MSPGILFPNTNLFPLAALSITDTNIKALLFCVDKADAVKQFAGVNLTCPNCARHHQLLFRLRYTHHPSPNPYVFVSASCFLLIYPQISVLCTASSCPCVITCALMWITLICCTWTRIKKKKKERASFARKLVRNQMKSEMYRKD